jgi:hypothetical protein
MGHPGFFIVFGEIKGQIQVKVWGFLTMLLSFPRLRSETWGTRFFVV